jgi:hypothetical protein
MTKQPHIQIRSFVLGGNHGQYLQAAGLSKMVKELVPNARVSHAYYNNHFWDELKIQARSLQLPKFLAMRLHWARQIEMSSLTTPADVRIYGADQIWSFSNSLFPPDPVFFGAEDNAHKIAFAPAMGHVTPGFAFPDWAKDALEGFKSLAVRDEATVGVVERSLGRSPELVVDPALFLLEGDTLSQRRTDKLLTYDPGVRSNLPKLLSAGSGLLDNWPIELHGYVPRREAWRRLGTQLSTPEFVVERIAGSRLLLTSTFHGVMMALMSGTPFVAKATPSLIDRLASPVGREVFGSYRLLSPKDFDCITRAQIECLLDPSDIDRSHLKSLIAHSRDWLSKALAKAGIEIATPKD